MDDARRIELAADLGSEFAAAARLVEADDTVPSCPEWSMRDLVDHVAMEYGGWYYSNLTIAPGHPDPIAAALEARPPVPEDYRALVEYVERNAQRFANRAAEVDLDRDTWVFNSVAAARFWLRQTLMEVAIHVWDADMVAGRPSPLDLELSLEGIDQVCVMQYHRGQWWGDPWVPPSTPCGLVAEDTGATWLMHEVDGRAHTEPAGGETAPLQVRAPGESLYLWLFGREPPEIVDVVGDLDLVEQWRPAV